MARARTRSIPLVRAITSRSAALRSRGSTLGDLGAPPSSISENFAIIASIGAESSRHE